MPMIALPMTHSTGRQEGLEHLSTGSVDVRLTIKDGRLMVPFAFVKAAQDRGYQTAIAWPPRVGVMAPPDALADDPAFDMPDGSVLVRPTPYGGALDVPLQFIPALEILGWTSLRRLYGFN